jgi:branched-chain amino acid transport system substrate-binding protein
MKTSPARCRFFREGMRLNTFALVLSISLITLLAPGAQTSKTIDTDDGPIKVGVYVDLTGQTSSYGQSTQNGIKLAASEINADGGVINRQIELVIEDDEGEPGKASLVVKKLIKEDKVHALLGEVASTNSLAAAPQAQEARVPMITPSSTHPSVTRVGDYIFRTCFIDPLQGEAMAKFAFESLRASRAAILFDSSSDFSRGLTETFERKFTDLGGSIVHKQGYDQRDRDFSPKLISIRAARPDVIFLPGYYPEVGAIAKQARQLKLKQPLLGGDGWDAPQLWDIAGKSMNNSYMSHHYAIDAPSPIVRKFVASYTGRYNSSPDAIAALGYDAMMLLADAIKRAGTTEGQKLRAAIAHTRNFLGVTGLITINAERNATKPVVIVRLLNGKYTYIEAIWPDNPEHH